MIRRTTERAWGYYRRHGFLRLAWAILFKVRQKLQLKLAAYQAGAYDPRLARRFVSSARVDPAGRPASEVFRAPNVAIIGDLNLPQCKKYRVLQKVEALEHLGITCSYSSLEDIPRSLNILQMATSAIFYRASMNETFQLYLDECKRLRIPSIYDIDDPIFSEEIYSANSNLAHLKRSEMEALLASTEGYKLALQACDSIIVSTPRLVDEARMLGKENVSLWRNAVDGETMHAVSRAIEAKMPLHCPRSHSENITVIYCSGSRAHEADFRQIENELVNLLESHQNLLLKIVGYLNIPATLKGYEDRLTVEPFSDYDSYIAALAEADISIIPLVRDDFNDCKSAIRFMEAALVCTPSIVSAIGDFMHLIADGENGYLASSSEDWCRHLRALVDDAALRERIGQSARASVLRNLTVGAITNGVPDDLRDLLYAR